jgi:hypothetical protein
MKKIALILGLFLCLSFVAARPIMDPATPQVIYNTDSPVTHNTVPSTPTQKQQSQTSDEGGSLLTKWVWNGKECVKADILSIPFTIGARSTYMYPYVTVKTNTDGSRVIRRILPGRIAVAFNPETRAVQWTPDCSHNRIDVQPLEPNWFR